MENIYFLLIILAIFWYFIYLRKVSEVARRHIIKYCKTENLQFISIARRNSKLRFNRRYGPHFLSTFDIEFSGDGESKYQGAMFLRAYKLESIELPAYRI